MKVWSKYSIIFLILILIQVGWAKAQPNLVPNYSFEIDTLCPDNGSQIDYAIPWHSATGGSPDYFNACDGSAIISVGVPQNWCGNQNARTGDAYSGIYG